jgi:hypothetical protein
MRTKGCVLAGLPLFLAALGLSGCKMLSERYIALEVWKYELCFGHLPPGFTPAGAAGAAAAPPRICGQDGGCQPAGGCDPCQGGSYEGGMPMGGMPMSESTVPATIGLPGGPGGSPGPSAGMPTPAGITTGRPIVISDEIVMP